ncbi:MAG TPA: DUF2007 domain-containing protein [Terriglobales bacterium]|nr:DUF2007 domain-containing protein [Terriglobales bacterium]
MSKVDPLAERERLAHVYAAYVDEELDKLLEAADELSEPAREALKAEIERRGGHVEYEWESPGEEREHPEPVVVATFRDLDQAAMARGVLQSAGIESFLTDENTVRMDWFWSNMLGNMRLLVRAEDAEAAKEILAQPIPQNFETSEGDPLYEQPKCPKCGSLDIEFEGWNRVLGLTAAAVLAPLPVRRDAWKCHTCGAEWQELPDENVQV